MPLFTSAAHAAWAAQRQYEKGQVFYEGLPLVLPIFTSGLMRGAHNAAMKRGGVFPRGRPSCSPLFTLVLHRLLLPVLFALIVLLAGMLPVRPVYAQGQIPPVSMTVIAGYEGSYRTSQWFPVIAEVGNDGPDLRGVLEWRFPGQSDGGVFQREVDLPRGARKRLVLYALSNSFARSGELRLLVGGNELASEIVRLSPIDPGQMIVGVFSSDPTMLNSLAGMQFPNASGVNVVHLESAAVPDNAVGLSGLDVIFIHDLPTADLQTAQREALQTWTLLGGQLVIGGGANAERTSAGLSALLPLTLEQLVPEVSLAGLAALNPPDGRAGNLSTTTVNRGTLVSGATALDREQLITDRPYGAGRVIFAAFDLAALRAWSNEALLWSQIVRAQPTLDPAASYRWQNDSILRNALQLPALRLPSFWVLVLFLLVYILIIGPVNFLVLRRVGRAELAWLTTPALVLLFLVGTYLTGTLLRGNRPQITQVAVVQGFEREQQSKITAFIGVFSPNRRNYTFTVPPETLISSGRGGFDDIGGASPVVFTESSSELRDLLVDVSALRTFAAERIAGPPPSVVSSLTRNGTTVNGEVRNTGDRPLRDAAIVLGNSTVTLGTLEPGESRRIQIRAAQGNFPGGMGLPEEGLLNRQRIVSDLFDFNQFGFGGPGAPNFQATDGMPDREGVYLLAWSEQPVLETALSGSNEAIQGVTLYVIRLNGAP